MRTAALSAPPGTQTFTRGYLPGCIVPTPLSRGSTVGIFASSLPVTLCDSQIIERSYRYLDDLGLKIKEAQNLHSDVLGSAGHAQDRAEAFTRLYCDPTVDGLLSFWGGWTSNDMLPHLDFNVLRKHPKLVIGASDTTALLTAFWSRLKLSTVFGSAVVSFGSGNQSSYTTKSFVLAAFGTSSSDWMTESDRFSTNDWWRDMKGLRHELPSAGWSCFREGYATGHALAATASVLTGLAGTRYWPEFNNAILFLEEAGVTSYGAFCRHIAHLKMLGVFDNLSALVLGRFEPQTGIPSEDIRLILKLNLGHTSYPVLFDVDFGHTIPSFSIPQGRMMEVDAQGRRIRFAE